MPIQANNRYHEALLIFLRSPLSSMGFMTSGLLNRQRAYRLNFRGLRLWVRPASPDLKVVRSCLLGEFDDTLMLIGDKHEFIVDAGGYISVVSILLAQRFPRAQIVCIEPSAENYALAKKNCAPWPNIDVLNCALAPEDGKVMLKDRGTGQWGFTTVEVAADAENPTELGMVDAVSIGELMKQYEKAGIDFLKLDIEGAEYALLRDRPEWIRHCGVIVAEIHERICPGATEAFVAATAGRREIPNSGEKRISITPDVEFAVQ